VLRYTWCGDGRWQFGTLAVDGWGVTFGRAIAVGIWYTGRWWVGCYITLGTLMAVGSLVHWSLMGGLLHLVADG